MEEALEILWTYARRQPIESNGKTVVASISQSIAAIRIIMRLERWLQKSKERKVKPGENLELGYVGEQQSVMSVADYTSFEEEEEEEVSPFAPFLLDEVNHSPNMLMRACSSYL